MKIVTTLVTVIGILTVCSLNAAHAAMAVNETGAAPQANAMLDVSSTTKGFLPPRMTYDQRTALFPTATSSATGMLVYQTDSHAATSPPGLYYYSGVAWTLILLDTVNSSITLTVAANTTLSAGQVVQVNNLGQATAINPASGSLTAIGVASSAANAGQSVAIIPFGNMAGIFSNLTPGSSYYIQSNGTYNNTTATTCPLGVAIDSSTMFLYASPPQ